MKKTLIALAVLAASGASFAQSSVTLSGVYSFSYQKDLTSTTANPTYIGGTSTPSGALTAGAAKGFAVTDANLKLAAVEDLGGGLKASFDYTLETGAQRGTMTTRADSGIGLSGGFGAVALRNTRSSDLIAAIGSPAVNLPDGLYDSSDIVKRGAIDAVSYTLPAFNGVTASFTFSEAAGTDGNISLPATDKSAYTLGVVYASGPLTVGAALKSMNSPASTTKATNYELMAAYDLGVAKVSYAFDGKSETTGVYASDAQGVSVTVPMGALTLGANYFKRDTKKVTEVGAAYAFSKRTTLSVASGKQTADAAGNQMRVRLAHSF
jgi:predicted porin